MRNTRLVLICKNVCPLQTLLQRLWKKFNHNQIFLLILQNVYTPEDIIVDTRISFRMLLSIISPSVFLAYFKITLLFSMKVKDDEVSFSIKTQLPHLQVIFFRSVLFKLWVETHKWVMNVIWYLLTSFFNETKSN